MSRPLAAETVRTMWSMRLFLRAAGAVISVVLVAGACGGAAEVEEDLGPGVALATLPAEPTSTVVSSTTAAVVTTTTTVDPASTTTTVLPPAEHETFVAHVNPEVTELVAYTETGGTDIVPFEFRITNPTYWGSRLSLMVLERTPDGEWLRVQIPVRPTGTEGWIPATDVELESHFIRARVIGRPIGHRLGSR